VLSGAPHFPEAGLVACAGLCPAMDPCGQDWSYESGEFGPAVTFEKSPSPFAEHPNRSATASVLQASGFRGDVTVFRLNAAVVGESGFEPALGRNTAERVYATEAAHNPEVAGSNPAPATEKAPQGGAFVCS
jgi:hypothetical protein